MHRETGAHCENLCPDRYGLEPGGGGYVGFRAQKGYDPTLLELPHLETNTANAVSMILPV